MVFSDGGVRCRLLGDIEREEEMIRGMFFMEEDEFDDSDEDDDEDYSDDEEETDDW